MRELKAISCKYYLPCGMCDKTGGTCTQYGIVIKSGTDKKILNEYIQNISSDDCTKISSDENGYTITTVTEVR